MTSMDPTTADTIDADTIDADAANKIARQDQDVTGGFQPISGESNGAETANIETQNMGDGLIAGETAGAGRTEHGDKQYPGD